MTEQMQAHTEEQNPLVEISTMLRNMLELQHVNNINTAGEDYLNKRLDWDSAIIVETAEMVDSSGYKWWKDQTIDVENIKTELVDIWHFLMSKFMCASAEPSTISNFIEHFSKVYTNVFIPVHRPASEFKMIFNGQDVDTNALRYFAKQMQKRILNGEDFQVILLSLVEMLATTQMSFEEFYKRYMIKNALNTLRQNRGYKDGSYRKEWTVSGLTGEDNEVALNIMMNSDHSEFEDIYNTLVDEYDKMVSSSTQ